MAAIFQLIRRYVLDEMKGQIDGDKVKGGWKKRRTNRTPLPGPSIRVSFFTICLFTPSLAQSGIDHGTHRGRVSVMPSAPSARPIHLQPLTVVVLAHRWVTTNLASCQYRQIALPFFIPRSRQDMGATQQDVCRQLEQRRRVIHTAHRLGLPIWIIKRRT